VEIKTGGNATSHNRVSGNGSAAIRVYDGGGGVVEDNDLRGSVGHFVRLSGQGEACTKSGVAQGGSTTTGAAKRIPILAIDGRFTAMPSWMRQRIFIGSSSEKLHIARAIHADLSNNHEPTIWNQGIFGLSQDVLSGLLEHLTQTDAAVLVLAPDDLSSS